MRYHYEKPAIYLSMYGKRYICEHPIYDSCTLFEINERGLAVIQQRFDPDTKSTFWTEVDPWLTDALYLHPNFKEFFDSLYGWALSNRDNPTDHVGSENETHPKGALGNSV